MSAREPVRLLSASGQLGYGILEAAFRRGLERRPHLIGADMGSVDPGPAYLGTGRWATTPEMSRRDLALCIDGARSIGVPLVIGSAGTAGARPHLDAVVAMVRDIARERGHRFRLAWITADIAPGRVKAARDAGRLEPLGAIAMPTDADLATAPHIVAQMGDAPIAAALAGGAEVVIAGRACDTAIYAAYAVARGCERGLSTHAAKIIECASLCCSPGGREAMLATLDDDGFVLDSMNPNRHATPTSVAAHALYEQADPFVVAEPDGTLDLSAARYRPVDEHRVHVSGAAWRPGPPSLKLEAAGLVGHRAVLIAGTSDPRVIARLETIWQEVTAIVSDLTGEDAAAMMTARFYGVDGVMAWPAPPERLPREVGILVQCVGPKPEKAKYVLATTKQYLLHHGFPGRLSTAGNLAFPFTPPEIDAGPAWRFVLHHRMLLEDAAELASLFPIAYEAL